MDQEIDWDAQERAAIEAENEDGPSTRGMSEPPPKVEPPLLEPSSMVNTAPANVVRLRTFGEDLKKWLPRVRDIIPKHVSPERLFAVAHMALERNPKIMECTSISILRGIVLGAQMGLDVSGVGGMAYLVPFKNNKTGSMEAQFMVGYRGMIELARRSKDVAWVFAKPVYRNEQFDYSVNPVPRIFHKPLPMFEEDRGDFVGAYAMAIYRDGAIPPQPEVMTKREIDSIRARSRAGQSGPWVTDYEAMACKTVVRKLCKMLPQSPELAAALDIEDRVEAGESIALPGEVNAEADEEGGGAIVSRTEEVKAKINRGRPPGSKNKPKV
jgi:recombination protein RecT